MQLLIFGFSLLGLLFLWKYIWQKTLLDETRDRLFCLREEVRQWFIDEGYDLSHPIYQSLRATINQHLRHTESITVISYLSFCISIEKNPRYDKYLSNNISKMFTTDDEKLKIFISKTRKKASDILIVHMGLRSLFITSLVAIMIIAKIIRYLFENIRLFFTQKISFRDQLVFASMILCLFTSVTRTNHLTMEKYSNESNLDNSKNQIVHSC